MYRHKVTTRTHSDEAADKFETRVSEAEISEQRVILKYRQQQLKTKQTNINENILHSHYHNIIIH